MPMLKEIVVLAKPERVPFYKLLGLQNVVPVDKGTVALKIGELKTRKDLAAILVEESIAREANIDVLSLNEKGLGPVITTIPDAKPFLEADPRNLYAKFISRVIGYQLGV